MNKQIKIVKTKSFALIVIAILMASVTMITMPIQPVKAQEGEHGGTPGAASIEGGIPLPSGVTPGYRVVTKAFMSFRPNPIGLGESLLVNMWITPPQNPYRYVAGYIVTLTKPDGTKVTVGPINSYFGDTTAWFEYTVDQVGTWKLKFDMPGAYYPAGNYTRPGQSTPPGYATVAAGSTTNRTAYFPTSTYYEPSSTLEQELVVQQTQVLSWPPSPLPTNYWTRPVQSDLREWAQIMGDFPWRGPGGGFNWPADTSTQWNAGESFTPYVQAPNSAHVAWKMQGSISGIIGARSGQWSFATGAGNPTIVYQGRAFQTYSKPGVGTSVSTYWKCYDLRTGQLYWERPLASGESAPTFIEYYLGTGETPGAEVGAFNMGIYPISISNGRLVKYDAWTGTVSVNVSISPLTTGTYYMNGYALSVNDLGTAAGAQRYRLINWTTLGPTDNFTNRILSNMTFPLSSLSTTTDYEAGITATAGSITDAGVGTATGTTLAGISLTTGQVLWNITVPGERQYSGAANVADHGKVALLMMSGGYMAWDLYSGKLAWTSEKMAYPWSYPGFGAYAVQSAYGLLYREAYDGVYAFNWTNGKIAWKYEAPAQNPFEDPYTDENGQTVYSFDAGGLVADGKLYTYTTEHTPSQPVTRGWRLHCINANTGKGIWNITGTMSPGAVADGYLTASNSYDGYMYVFGKGKSATTVTAPDVVIPKGNGIVIKGTVLDLSPGQPGTPCVSKDSMTLQMEYLHMQMPIAGLLGNETITGVPVTLTAIDSNGNVVDIGTTTTNGYYGTFGYTWTPPNEGQYTILASFAGDGSYGSSASASTVSVGPAPVATATPTSSTAPSNLATTSDLILYIVGVGIAIIIAVAIVGVLLLRKH